MNEWREGWLVRGMNERTDESASDKHEVTGIKHYANTALVKAAKYHPGKV